MSAKSADFGVIGLGVMGSNLALNMERSGLRVAGFDQEPGKARAFASRNPGKDLAAFAALESFLDAVARPRRILMMVPAGEAVDRLIASLGSRLCPGDVLIDGGNSHFADTERRSAALSDGPILFLGMGVSGGESGALWGPSLMPGGPVEAWQQVRPTLEAIAAKVDGEPCVAHIGPRGAGHYVKMVHNAIEYGDMQLIAEVYDLLRRGLGLNNAELHTIFSEWNQGVLQSYLVEISAAIFAKVDEETGQAVVDLILDEAQQKGTGKWASQNAFDLGAAIPTLNAAVEARLVSALKAERSAAAQVLPGPPTRLKGSQGRLVRRVGDALYAAKVCSYAQGFAMLHLASHEYDYGLNCSELARIWRGGCIIQARFLEDIRTAFGRNPQLTNLLLDEALGAAVVERQSALREVVQAAVGAGIPVPAFSAALAYFDSYRSARLPANLTQAQRDFFGAHTYRRVDREGSFHTEWEAGTAAG